MKYSCFFVFLLPLFIQAQECKLIRETDPYTKETRLTSGALSLPGASLSIEADSKEVDFFFTVADKCFTDASTVFIFFEGSKAKMTTRNSGSMNCEGSFHFNFRNGASTPYLFQKLSTLKVTQFIFIGTDKKETVLTLAPEQQEKLLLAAGCMVKDAKTLVK